MTNWTATHEINIDGERTLVMCVPSDEEGSDWMICYSSIEWDTETSADYEYHPESGLMFQGASPAGNWTLQNV